MVASLLRVAPTVIRQYLGRNSTETWSSQSDLADAATWKDARATAQDTSIGPVNRNTAADSASIGKAPAAPNSQLLYVHRLDSTSKSHTQCNEDLMEAYGAYQLTAASQYWLSDCVCEEASLQNALRLAALMETTSAEAWLDGELSSGMLQAIHELYWFYEHRGNLARYEALCLQYPAAYEKW